MEDSSPNWPTVFESLRSRLCENSAYVTIAESWEEQRPTGLCARTLTCGLVLEDQYELLAGDQDLGHQVDATGPYPCPSIDEYTPRFWIFGTPAIPDDIEPIVLSWTSNNRTTQQPDPGLLMTYGLMPRVEQGGTIHWDEPAKPMPDVLLVKPLSIYEHFSQTPSSVTIRREYLQDYASLRQRSIVCVFYERWIVENDEEAHSMLAGDRYWERRFKDAYIRIQSIIGEESKLHIDIWGHRLLIRPSLLPVSEDENSYGSLNWPGITESINDKNWRGQGMNYVYVKDDVLGHFEGRPEYKIIPESGSVAYGHQWSVGYCDRIGRDLIRLEVKKLYEGNPPTIVRHFHKYAVFPPSGDMQELLQSRNVGVRAKDIVYGLVELGEAISGLASRLSKQEITTEKIVSLSRSPLDHDGWWNAGGVEPLCRHIPISATRDLFVNRCKDLYRFVGEGLQEKTLRKILIQMGVDAEIIKDFRSLKLMSTLIQHARLAKDAGLDPVNDSKTVIARNGSQSNTNTCKILFALNSLRQLDAHPSRKSYSSKLENGLRIFDIDPMSTAAGYGHAIDMVYDKVYSELKECTEAFDTV